ncbi:type II secretion system protein GspM [Miltoncostaea oceani]|uniref:type II secretion system protein GspM n=1 Tax=Miltoncostaea oceani TaxID=2843216 RepID=UPI001C3CDDD0|nr:type II secretion system protein GspM [Miltoncostaea oceani]
MKLSKRDMILLAVIGAIAVLGGAYWFVVKPAKAELSAQKDELVVIQGETAGLRDTLSRLEATATGEGARVAERLRLAKAIPDSVETPGVVVQLQRLADRANVELTSIKTNTFTDYGAIRGTEFEVRVSGRFFDVDDFLYRLHRQVSVDERDRPVIGGRLFATTSVDLTLSQADTTGGGADDGDMVIGTVKVVAFSSVPGGVASSAAVAPGTPVAATTTTGGATPAPGTTTNEPTTAPAGGAQATATPSSGGTQ